MSELTTTKPVSETRFQRFLRFARRPIVMWSAFGLTGLTLVIVFTSLYAGNAPGEDHGIRVPSPDDSHKYKVTVSHFSLTNPARRDPYKPTEDRRIMVSLYMPVPKKLCSSECDESYMPPGIVSIINQQFIEGNKEESVVFGAISYGVCCGTSADVDVGKVPVVVLEPHVDTSRLMYSTIVRFLSANGVAVVVIDHPGDASIVQFTSSRTSELQTVYNSGTVPLSNLSPITDYNDTVRTAVDARVDDIAFTLSQINSSALLDRQEAAWT